MELIQAKEDKLKQIKLAPKKLMKLNQLQVLW